MSKGKKMSDDAVRGAEPSHGAWPGGAGLAVWVVPNIEMFDEGLGIDGSAPGETQRFTLREYGNREGVPRLRELFSRYSIPATAAVNAWVAEATPDLLREAVERDGWELMGHGFVNNRRLPTYPAEQEGDVIASCIDLIERASGTRPAGWLSPGMSETQNTLRHLAANGIRYTGDLTTLDSPYDIDVDGRTITAVPYGVDVNDKPSYDHKGMTPDEFADLAIRQFDYLREEAASRPRVFCLALHPYLSGVPHRMPATERILRHLRECDDAWIATGSEIVSAFRARRG